MEAIPFCPNRSCELHYPPFKTRKDWFYAWGSYKSVVIGKIPRFKCRKCGTTFSIQTFSLDYYSKRLVDYIDLEASLNSSMGIRALGRLFKVNTQTVQNRIARMARQSIGLAYRLIKTLALIEDLVSDGFETFCLSQYYPCNINLLLGKDSKILLAADFVTLRRKGVMKEAQKQRRAQLEKLWKPDPKALENSYELIGREILSLLERRKKEHITLFTDQNPAYIRGLHRTVGLLEKMEEGVFSHVRISSKLPRTVDNSLFSANYYDRELRKDQAAFVRESTRFARNVDDTMNRLTVYGSYHNFRKAYRIKSEREDPRTHGEAAGIEKEKIAAALEGYYSQRVFFSHLALSSQEIRTWFRMWENPGKKGNKYVPYYTIS